MTDNDVLVLLSGEVPAQAQVALFVRDIDAAIYSYEQVATIRKSVSTRQLRELMFYASSFVCAVRRAGRMLEAMVKSKAHYKPPAGEAIQLAWKKRKCFFHKFIEPRNAIEHIDGEIQSMTQPKFFNMWHDSFEVVDGESVQIDTAAFEVLQECRGQILAAVASAYARG